MEINNYLFLFLVKKFYKLLGDKAMKVEEKVVKHGGKRYSDGAA